MSVLLLVRHGQATFGLGTYDRLSDQGRAQALRLGRQLAERGVHVDRIVSGAMERQRETAEIIAAQLELPAPSVEPRWDEYDHLPLITRVRPAYRKHWRMVADLARSRDPGRALQEVIDEALATWIADDVAGAPGPSEDSEGTAESHGAFIARTAAALEGALAPGGTTLAVSSAGAIAAAVGPHAGLPVHAWPRLHRVVVNASVTKVVRGARGISLISFNEHGHLEGAPSVKVTYR